MVNRKDWFEGVGAVPDDGIGDGKVTIDGENVTDTSFVGRGAAHGGKIDIGEAETEIGKFEKAYVQPTERIDAVAEIVALFRAGEAKTSFGAYGDAGESKRSDKEE